LRHRPRANFGLARAFSSVIQNLRRSHQFISQKPFFIFFVSRSHMLNPTKKIHKSHKDWLVRHVNDAYVLKAKQEGYRSRAAYKLAEIDAKDKLVSVGGVIVDLGAAPGSWSQYVVRKTDGKATLIAIDLLEMQGLSHVDFIQGDFTEASVLAEIEAKLAGRKVDLVMSDMLPNMSGVANIDSPRAIYLCELAADFAINHLKPEGKFLTKAYQGPGYQEFFAQLKQQFKTVVTRKPEASRDRSAEIFLLGTGLR
jgi:23S rRNA (uridine2552-2'-O)-methyltransferase